MNILLTNDDGYKAEGINYLRDYFEKKDHHKVFVVACEKERSGASHSLTFTHSIKLIKNIDNLWVIDGTPADCVILSVLGLLPVKIDLVISGINHGPNIGRDIIYSGTVACARQGAFYDIPSIALSINGWKGPYYMETVGDFLDKHLDMLIKVCDKSFFYNINFPNLPADKIKGIKNTNPCDLHYNEGDLVYFDSPYQGRYYWMGDTKGINTLEEGTDAKAVKDGYISVSSLKIFPESCNVDLKF